MKKYRNFQLKRKKKNAIRHWESVTISLIAGLRRIKLLGAPKLKNQNHGAFSQPATSKRITVPLDSETYPSAKPMMQLLPHDQEGPNIYPAPWWSVPNILYGPASMPPSPMMVLLLTQDSSSILVNPKILTPPCILVTLCIREVPQILAAFDAGKSPMTLQPLIRCPCFLAAPVSWQSLYPGSPCILAAHVFWQPIYPGNLCILATPVSWQPQYPGSSCIMAAPEAAHVSWQPL